MRKFDGMTSLGLIVGAGLIVKAIMDGGEIKIFINIPSLLIAVGGSFAAILINFTTAQIKNVMKVTKNAFSAQIWNANELPDLFGTMAYIARREGLLGLENEMGNVKDDFFRRGIQMVIDGADSEEVKKILETELDCLQERHQLGQKFFLTWGNFAPAFGMVGTLIGLVQMLANLSDPTTIGPSMAVALLTTLYGSVLANLVLNPIAGKLALRSDEEIFYKGLVIEGVLAIQAGTNPMLIQEMLQAFTASENVKKDKGIKGEVSANVS